MQKGKFLEQKNKKFFYKKNRIENIIAFKSLDVAQSVLNEMICRENNTFNGHGEYIWADGRKYVGTWMNNMMHGEGELKYEDGRIYKGEYQNDLKHGKGVYTWPNGKRMEGTWIKGKHT